MENWIAVAVGKMHVHKITQSELAEKIGIRRDYLNRILNGKIMPNNAEQRIMSAIDDIVS